MKFSELDIQSFTDLSFHVSCREETTGLFKWELAPHMLTYLQELLNISSYMSFSNLMKVHIRGGTGLGTELYTSLFGESNSFSKWLPTGNSILFDETFKYEKAASNRHCTLYFSPIKPSDRPRIPREEGLTCQIFISSYSGDNPKNLKVFARDIRNGILVNWENFPRKGAVYIVYLMQGEDVIFESEILDSNTTSYTIPESALSVGAFKVKVVHQILANIRGSWYGKSKYSDGQLRDLRHSSISEEITITDRAPKILSLEPSGVEVNRDKPVVISWSSEEQDFYNLNVNGITYFGASEKTITLPPGTLRAGQNTMTLSVGNYVENVVKSIEKTVFFQAYEKPLTPAQDDKTLYSTATPTFNWKSTDQVAYRLKVWRGSQLLVDTLEVAGVAKSYRMTYVLQNNTDYIVEMAIKNQKNLWSDYSRKTIRTRFEVLSAPRISVFTDDLGNIIVNANNTSHPNFEKTEIWRKTDFQDWHRMAINLPLISSFRDNTVGANTTYYYKALTYSKEGGVSESEIRTKKVSILRAFFVDIENLKSNHSWHSGSPESIAKFKKILDKAIVHYDGKRAPDIEIGEAFYTVGTFSLMFKTYEEYKRFYHFVENAKLLLYRDEVGRKIYGHVTDWGLEEETTVGYLKISFTFTESHFVEKDIYDASKPLQLNNQGEGWGFV